MTGERLKKVIVGQAVSLTEMARRLEMSPQHLNQALSAADVKSGLVERVSSALDIPISHIYGEGSTIANIIGNGCNNNTQVAGSSELAVLQEKVKLLEQLLEEKERTIQILMK